jgi:ATP-dependent DNA helicase RecG
MLKNMMPEEVSRWAVSEEGQFFERKSAIDRSNDRVRQRKAADVVRDIVDTLSAMANADGGELVVGIENDGTVTGLPYAPDKIQLMLQGPGNRNYLDPPLRYDGRELQLPDGKRLLHFEVEWSHTVHRLTDGRYLLRVKDSNMPFPADQIAALKQTKAQGLFERSFPPGASASDLDSELIQAAAPGIPRAGVEQFLLDNHLVERRGEHLIPNHAALLLFGKDPQRWHPRCGIDFVRWEGTERKYGAELNVVKRIRVEAPLARIIERAYTMVQPFIRERQQLQDLLFTERLEYPTFVWQEAIVNAVAHRDYSIRGAPIEIWMFDDRLEVRSPGLPPSPVTVDALNRRERVHISRNPLIVRVLVELGYVRELGEGVPRMFAEMERQGFYPPHFENVGDTFFQVTLRNQPVYDRPTLEWLQRFEEHSLTGDQKRLLAYAHAHENRFTSREYQKLVGLDIYGASNSIRELVRKGVVRSIRRGSRIYEVIEPGTASDLPPPDELLRVLGAFRKEHSITNDDVRRVLGVSRPTAARYLRNWTNLGWLRPVGERSQRRYEFVP